MEMYDYFFHYNPYTQLWHAVHRNDYISYFNDHDSTEKMSARDISVLIDMISRGAEFLEKMKKISQ